jgi:hypothetical protein
LTAVTFLAIVCAAIPSLALAADPHENPETAEQVFSGISLFRYYSASLESVLKKNPEEVQAKLDKMPFANIPASVQQATDDFTSSGISISYLVAAIDEDLSKLETLVGESRFEEASQLADKTFAKLDRANGDLKKIEMATMTTGTELKVPSAPEGSELRKSYDEVLERIQRIGAMLDLYKEILANLLKGTEQIEKLLKPTEVTLKTEPMVAFVGDEIRFEGTLTSEGEPLARREVDILLNGSGYATTQTDTSGYYQGTLQVPYRYVPELNLQALYYPRDEDIGWYISSQSSVVKLRVLFYEARLEIALEKKAYPGLETTVTGRFDYGQSPIPSERRVEIYLDDALIAEIMAQETFAPKIRIAPAIDVGKHTITVSAVAAGRYSPVATSAILDVTRATPILDINVPKLAMIPGSITLGGKLYSEVGPLNGASIKMGLGKSQVELVSSEDGAFNGKIRMGMTFGLIGSRDLVIEVIPQEPWHAPLKTTASVLMVNVVSLSGFCAVLVFLGIYLPNRLKRRLGVYRRRGIGPVIAPHEPGPTYSTKVIAVASTEESAGNNGEPKNTIFHWYRLVVRLLKGITKAVLPPQQTLREFANETSTVLGPAAKYFLELTGMVERLLYSEYRPTEEDVEKSQQLSHNIEEVFKGEGV